MFSIVIYALKSCLDQVRSIQDPVMLIFLKVLSKLLIQETVQGHGHQESLLK
jgi:hypothetical protein